MTTDNEQHKIADESADRKYFTLTPHLVWALCESPYEYTLWSVIKMVAGEDGECYLNTRQLASLSMMSTGMVCQCRQRLLDIGLLEGEERQDPGWPCKTWHLRVPNLWPANIEWREEHGDSLLKRIDWKEKQISLAKARKRAQRVKTRNRVHQVNKGNGVENAQSCSPGEQGHSPGEQGRSPGETKKNHKEKPKEEPLQQPLIVESHGIKVEI